MKYIVATSDNNYFRWQMLVQINNFKRLKILDDLVYVISTSSNKKTNAIKLIEESTGVKIFIYKDERINNKYVSSIRPHIMKKFLSENPEYNKMFFYLDPDVLFIKKPKFTKKILTDKYWYVSDTRSYLDSKYIKSKSENLFREMCMIIDIHPKTVEKNDGVAGGAQYIIKNSTSEFWEKVENDSEVLYDHLSITIRNRQYNPAHPIQSWTTDMWAVLWNAWNYGYETSIIDSLNFSWATDSIDRWNKFNIYHNAGVVGQTYLFDKTKFYNKKPFNEDFSYVKPDYCSHNYVKEILETSKNYPNIINKI